MSVKQFIHYWKDDEGKLYIAEQYSCSTVDEAIEQYFESHYPESKYSHTIIISYSLLMNDSMVSEIDIETIIEEREEAKRQQEKEDYISPESQKLSLQQMGL